MQPGDKVRFNKGLYIGESGTIKDVWSFQSETENNSDNRLEFDWVVELKPNQLIACYTSELDLIKESIQVWQYEDCPEQYRKLIEDPSDLDWVVFVPNSYYYEDGTGEKHPTWLGFLNSSNDDETELLFEDGSKLLLMYHS